MNGVSDRDCPLCGEHVANTHFAMHVANECEAAKVFRDRGGYEATVRRTTSNRHRKDLTSFNP